MKKKPIHRCFILTLLSTLCVITTNTAFSGEAIPENERKYESFSTSDDISFVVAEKPWDVNFRGNHRAVVRVVASAHRSAIVTLPWRRSDLRPETKKIVVVDAQTGEEVKNVKVFHLSDERGVIAFEPQSLPGEYCVYYLPSRFRSGYGDARYARWDDYLPPEYAAEPNWVAEVENRENEIPPAEVLRFEARTKLDFFTPMGVIATAAEADAISKNTSSNAVIFAEDRTFPICLPHRLPVKWVTSGPKPFFEGRGAKNEYYTWQIGVWASKRDIKNLKVTFDDFTNGSHVIPAAEATCFNTGGINWDGRPVTFDVHVDMGDVQSLWCGVQIPRDAVPGVYRGQARLSDADGEIQTVPVAITVTNDILEDRGDGDLWRHSRLRWLNSTIGRDNKSVPPYLPIEMTERSLLATGKKIAVCENGLLENVRVNDRSVFQSPLRFVVETDEGSTVFAASNLRMNQVDTGLVEWTASSEQDGMEFALKASLEYDGYLRYNIKLKSDGREMAIKDVRLEMECEPYSSEYFMGAGYGGGFRPEDHTWNWQGPWDSCWIGGVLAGMHVEFRGGSYHGPLINDYKPKSPPVWSNNGQGVIRVEGQTGANAKLTASTGPFQLTAEPRDYEFALLVTPVKTVDTAKHFHQRYYHADPDGSEQGIANGATVFNIHHAQSLNPVINYPWQVREPLMEHINRMHDRDVKVKLYYTIRELTTLCEEVHAFKSLGHEIFVAGEGYGAPWLCEHLIDDYRPAWYSELPGQNYDAALVLNGFSRYLNYYLEGYRWMLENYKIDGVYMDDVAFDRDTMKRMRKIMAAHRPGALIDLHSNTGYSIGPANQYADFYPHVDRTWFGESFRYNEMTPDQWLVTFSGIPFGEMSEMLQDGGNPYLGLVYGTTNRLGWTNAEDHATMPIPVWNLWKSFGIEDSTMLGYWDENAAVETSHPLVKATAFVRSDRVLIVVGNFDNQDRTVTLDLDAKKLGFVKIPRIAQMPNVETLQESGAIELDKPQTISAKKGLVLILEK